MATSGYTRWGPGACPWCSFLRLSSKKVGLPRRSRRGPRGAAPQGGFGGTPPEGTQHRAAPGRWSGFGPAQVQTCNVGSRPVPGGGSRLSLEKARTQRVAGEDPRPPWVRGRSLSLARFGGCAALFQSMGYYGAHVRTLIWRLSFVKFFFSIFFWKMRPKSVLAYRRKESFKRIRENCRKN